MFNSKILSIVTFIFIISIIISITIITATTTTTTIIVNIIITIYYYYYLYISEEAEAFDHRHEAGVVLLGAVGEWVLLVMYICMCMYTAATAVLYHVFMYVLCSMSYIHPYCIACSHVYSIILLYNTI